MKARFTDEQIIAMIKEQEAGEKTADVCRRHGISSATFYKYKLLAEQMLDNAMLRDINSKKW
jgi:putative transposase